MALAPSASAQGGIEAGYLNARFKTKYIESGEISQRRSMNGFFVGASDDILFFSGFGIHTGLYYNFLRDRAVDDYSVVKLSGVTENHSFSIPLHLKMSVRIIPQMKLFFYFGPALHFNFISDVKYTVSSPSSKVTGSLTYNYLSGKTRAEGLDKDLEGLASPHVSDARLNWFDASLGVGAGFSFGDLLEVRFGYDWGLVNRFKSGYLSDMVCRVNQLQLSVGFRF